MTDVAGGRTGLDGIGVVLLAPGPDDPPGPVLERAAAAARTVERLGLGTLWVSESSPGPDGAAPYEAYSLLGALAARTGAVQLGVVAEGSERRAPSILAKVVTGVDVIAHGRAVLALDGDCAIDSDGQRLEESLQVCRAVLEDEHPAYAGRIYSIDGAVNRPAPVHPGGVPIVVFLHGDGPARRDLVEVAARTADAVVVAGGTDDVAEVVDQLAGRRRRGAAGADPVRVLAATAPGPEGSSDASARAAAARAAGATGCLVGIPHPWDGTVVEDPALLW